MRPKILPVPSASKSGLEEVLLMSAMMPTERKIWSKIVINEGGTGAKQIVSKVLKDIVK